MPAFCVGQIRVKNTEAWERYRSRVGVTLEQYGGEALFRGEQARVFSGAPTHKNIVVLKFENVDAANRWHDSPEYQALLSIRDEAADVTLVLYEGQNPKEQGA